MESVFQGETIGRGGLDITPSNERAPPVAPDILQYSAGAQSSTSAAAPVTALDSASDVDAAAVDLSIGSTFRPSVPKLLPRETGHDIGMGSPVPLSAEAVQVITRLRNMKDKDEDWSRWRDVVFRAKGALKLNAPKGSGLDAEDDANEVEKANESGLENNTPRSEAELVATGLRPCPSRQEPDADPGAWTAKTEAGTMYCTECYLPLHPDPEPERLYIFLHALRYTTSLGVFETEMPKWASKDWPLENGC